MPPFLANSNETVTVGLVSNLVTLACSAAGIDGATDLATCFCSPLATNLSDEEVEIFITEMQCLVDSWFDVYEKQAFDGLTLKELLKGG